MYKFLFVFLFSIAIWAGTATSMPDGNWGGNSQGNNGGSQAGHSGTSGRTGRQAQGFGGQGFGNQGGFGGQGMGGQNGGYGIKNWYNTPEGWGYDSTYPGGETHFHSKRGGGAGGFGGAQRGGNQY